MAAETETENTASADETSQVRKNRKVRDGIVTSQKMDKTVVVEVTNRARHPQYNKTVQTQSRYYVHDEENTLKTGDRVRIVETRPLSKLKRWRLQEILERAR